MPIALQASVIAIAVGLILVLVFYDLLEPRIKALMDWINRKERAERQKVQFEQEQETLRVSAEEQARQEIEQISLRGKG